MSTSIKISVNKPKEFTKKEQEYRREASRKVSMANKRLKRMEEQNLSMSPAFKKWIDDGSQKFGIRGKSTVEVKAEVARLNKFLNQTTSTVRGTKKYMSNIANQVGIKQWDSFDSLNTQLKDFFEVSNRVQEYLKNTKEVSVSIGYKKIWEQVNEYAETVGTEFNAMNEDIVEVAKSIIQANACNKIDELTDNFLDSFIDNFK